MAMFALGAFVLASVVQELWRGVRARRAMTRETPPVALLRLVRRNRRRYGGYIVHAGLAVLLIGVAASSSFQHSRDVLLAPGQRASVDGYVIRYVHPTVSATAQKISFGAVLRVSKAGKQVTTLRTARGFYPSQDPTQGAIGRFFNGEADSDVGLRAGLTKDIWTVVSPDLTPLQGLIGQGNRVFSTDLAQTMRRVSRLSVAQQQAALAPLWQYRDQAILAIAARYVTHPWPVEFLLIVDPLVTWIWLGAIIIAGGGLIALWPVPVPLWRRVRAERRARAAASPVTPAREPA
jgi:cytochrome c-type biogenesis protein CcmF